MYIDELYDKIIRNSKEAERQYLSMATNMIGSKKCNKSPLTDEAFKKQLERVLRDNVLDVDICITGDTVIGAKINPKEQKPIEYLDKDKVYAIMTKLTNLSYSQLIPINSDEYKQIYEITHDVRSLLGYPIKQKPVMIQWTGKNLKEVIDFTGKSPRFDEWFKSWEEFEDYVHSHDDILKLFCEDGSHYEVPVGAWIIKTPDGYNIPSRFRFIQKPTELERLAKLREMTHEIREAYERGIEVGRAESKQEWSREDEIRFKEALEVLNESIKHLPFGYGYTKDVRLVTDWLKSLHERLNLQPKQGWSEEDEENFKWFDKFFRAESVIAGGRDIPQDKYLWFKSLRPSWKPSEEELVALKRVGSILRDYGHSELAKMVFMVEGKLANLSVINKSIWKPSEEQLVALKVAMDRNDSIGYNLRQLYEQLKKL